MYRKALVEADKMAQKQVMRQFREFHSKEEALKKRITELEATLAAVPALGEPPPPQITDGRPELGALRVESGSQGRRTGGSEAARMTREEESVREEGLARKEAGDSRGAELEQSLGNGVSGALRLKRGIGADASGARLESGVGAQAQRGPQGAGVEETGVLSDDEEMLAEILNGGLSAAEAEGSAADREMRSGRDERQIVEVPRPSSERGQRERDVGIRGTEITATVNGRNDTLRSDGQLANPPPADLNHSPSPSAPVIPSETVQNASHGAPSPSAAATPPVTGSTGIGRPSPLPAIHEASASMPPQGFRPPPSASDRSTRVEGTVPGVPVVSVPPLPGGIVARRSVGPLATETIAGHGAPQNPGGLERSGQASEGSVASERAQAGLGRELNSRNLVTPAVPTAGSANSAANLSDPDLSNQAPVSDNPAGLGGVNGDRAATLEGLLQSGVFKSAARHRRKLLMTYKGGKQPGKKQPAPAPRKTDYVRQGEEGYVEGEPSTDFGRSEEGAGEGSDTVPTASGNEQRDTRGVAPGQPRTAVAHRSVGVGGPDVTGGIASQSVGNPGAHHLQRTEAVGTAALGMGVSNPTVGATVRPTPAVGATVRRAYFPVEVIPAAVTNGGSQTTVLNSTSTFGAPSTAVGAIVPAVEPPVVDQRIAPGLGLPVGLQGLPLGLGQFSGQPNRPSEQMNLVGLEEDAVAGQPGAAAKKKAPRKRKSAAETGEPVPRKRKKKTAGAGTSTEQATEASPEALGEEGTRATGTEGVSGAENDAGPAGDGVSGGSAGRGGTGGEKPKRKRVRKPDPRYFNPDGTRKPPEERPPPKPRRASECF